MAAQRKQGGKNSPKISRSARPYTKAKYLEQFKRTLRNKAKRVRRSNGEDAYKAWLSRA